MKAIIMAGGEGTRLRPLTCNIPKPMIPIMGKPVMEYIIELLKKNNITDIGVTLQYLPDEIINYFGDGKDWGVNIRYFIENTPLGTAGSVKNAEKFLDDTFIVISGDSLTDINLSKAIEYHNKKEALATLVIKEVDVPLDYGVVITDKNGAIQGFLEKPSWSEVFSDKVNTGIYILEPEVFTYYEKNQKIDFSNDLFPILLSNKKPLYGYVSQGYWCDIGNIEQFSKCNFDILNGLVDVKIKGEEYKKGIWAGENCEISSKAEIIPPVYLGSNCKIYPGTKLGPYISLGRNITISPGANINRSVIFDNCHIGNYADIKGSVLCKKVQLESRVTIFEDSAIGDETFIGERAVIKPGIKIWPNKHIDGSTTVKGNIIWGGKFSRSLFGKKGISGEVNVDITPEFVSKLGSAYGSIFKTGSKIAISCNDYGAAQMFKYSIATGLLSMGIEVIDLKRMTTSMTRQATKFFGVQGGIHVAVDFDNPQKVNILFFDNDGIDIDKIIERKIETSFIREDFRRVPTDSFKRINHMSDCIEYYTRNLINSLDIKDIKNKKLKIVVNIRSSLLLDVVTKVFNELGISVKLYDEYRDLVGLSKLVKECNANLGIYMSDDGENAVIIDENGGIIKDEAFEALNALVLLKTTKLKTLVAPVTASVTIEKIAE
ncbi:MAG: sugar phosphate nucleotidyltransferase, partial [Bacillota bacterium]|nr:sugar phosphate nucleotidyltransferase [Bacillota bacterium]